MNNWIRVPLIAAPLVLVPAALAYLHYRLMGYRDDIVPVIVCGAFIGVGFSGMVRSYIDAK